MGYYNNGGPAFPRVAHPSMTYEDLGSEGADAQAGMSLRDYFAAAALQGLVSVPMEPGEVPSDFPEDHTVEDWQRHYAKMAYGYADAMIAARKA